MARQRDVSDSGPSIDSEPKFLRKTHLTYTVRRTSCCSGVTYIYSFIDNHLASWVPHSPSAHHKL
jgi:hypothetical protein